MRNKLLIGIAGLFVAVALVGGTAVAVGGKPQPSTVALAERSASVTPEAPANVEAPTSEVHDDPELATITTQVPTTTPIVTTAPTVTVAPTPTTARQVTTTTTAPKVTTTTIDPKTALRTDWWTPSVQADWNKFQDNFYGSCNTTSQCQKFADANNKFSGDITGIKQYDKNLYVDAFNKMRATMDALSRVYTCNGNGQSGSAACNQADEDSVDAYMALVATLQGAGLPVTVQ